MAQDAFNVPLDGVTWNGNMYVFFSADHRQAGISATRHLRERPGGVKLDRAAVSVPEHFATAVRARQGLRRQLTDGRHELRSPGEQQGQPADRVADHQHGQRELPDDGIRTGKQRD